MTLYPKERSELKFALLIFSLILGSILYFEVILRIFTFGFQFSYKMAYILLFTFSLSSVFFLIALCFKRIQKLLIGVLLFLIGFVYGFQMYYYAFFKTFSTLYSIAYGGQVAEFYREIISMLQLNWFYIPLCLLPLIIYTLTVIGKKPVKSTLGIRVIFAFFAVVFHLAALGLLYPQKDDLTSPYQSYLFNQHPITTISNFGLITNVRLEVKRIVVDVIPFLSQPAPPDPDFEPEDPDPIEPEIEYNILNIDWETLIDMAQNSTIKDMHTFFSNQNPTKKNAMTGKYEGYNVILITAEGFSLYASRSDVTPTLYKMANEGYVFNNFYNPVWGVSTSDGEYVQFTGLPPKAGVWSLPATAKNHMPLVLGNQLKNLGYRTDAYHNHTYTYYRRHLSHPNLGYDYMGVGNGLDMKKLWPPSDSEMMEKTVFRYVNEEPFHTYYMTVSGHLNYTFTGNHMARRHQQAVKDLPYSNNVRAYLATQIELDKAMEFLLNALEEAGVAQRTLIALSSDHYPYGLQLSELEELAGHRIEKNFELYRSTFILYVPGMDRVVVDKPVSSMDILPTISNMLGLEYDSRLLMGKDAFSDSPPFIIFVNRSFITERGRYNASSKKFFWNDGWDEDPEYVRNMIRLVNAQFINAARIIEQDYYRIVYDSLSE